MSEIRRRFFLLGAGVIGIALRVPMPRRTRRWLDIAYTKALSLGVVRTPEQFRTLCESAKRLAVGLEMDRHKALDKLIDAMRPSGVTMDEYLTRHARQVTLSKIADGDYSEIVS